jgi:hypothetical protein
MRGALLQLLLFPLVLVPVLHAAPVVNRLRSLSALLENVADRELPMPPELKSQLVQLGHTLRQELNQADELGLTRVHRSVIEQDIDRLDALLLAGADYERPAGELNVIPLHLCEVRTLSYFINIVIFPNVSIDSRKIDRKTTRKFFFSKE